MKVYVDIYNIPMDGKVVFQLIGCVSRFLQGVWGQGTLPLYGGVPFGYYLTQSGT